MNPVDTGMICYRTTGRKAGQLVVITGFDKQSGMAMVQGKKGGEKKCNPKHLWITGEKVDAHDFMKKTVPGKKKKEKKERQKKNAHKERKTLTAGKKEAKKKK